MCSSDIHILRKGICQEKEFVHFKGAWKHIRTLEWKRNVTPVPSEMVRSLAQKEGVDPYHLNLVLISLFFEEYQYGFFS